MKFNQNSRVTEEIPSSSMADIAFLLIIFFMVTTVFAAQKGIDFNLPKEDEEAIDVETTEAVYIVIDQFSRITVDEIPMNLQEIKPYVKSKLDINPKKFIILQTDDNAMYGDMIDVLDELKQVNVINIALPTKEEIATWTR
ncbi:MAG: hypothetical protein A2161_09490 [Candidatus Schekmanbacteria bacterium RBG_13_48_7]|uniref:Biopolymer transporter ExbD n=1 Tax=Candidatus Schekmanbacteria bacterium RBG_13_48_7 TaxID=1817878 RepID=A0A1F7RKQ3_9BACT|nr:MAG: hypothetical protein A2161_09490 [Candidatus Schekmanbacteria bacterium RBG_13_48_7]